ncbi:hypothetical protein [Ferruginibacter sp.]|uniref:hypothetical protein n=1 Tax=Ferruginibacter sp. TaxID=1940288 RepID=UPI002658A93D|nr:hypothetical protein [Ferruginibacter sp.]
MYNAANQLVELKEYDYQAGTIPVPSDRTIYIYNPDGDKISSSDLFGNEQHFEYYPDITYSTPSVSGLPDPNAAKKITWLKNSGSRLAHSPAR